MFEVFHTLFRARPYIAVISYQTLQGYAKAITIRDIIAMISIMVPVVTSQMRFVCESCL